MPLGHFIKPILQCIDLIFTNLNSRVSKRVESSLKDGEQLFKTRKEAEYVKELLIAFVVELVIAILSKEDLVVGVEASLDISD